MDVDSSRDCGRGVRGRRRRAEPMLPLFHHPIQPLDRGDACRIRGVADRQDVQAVREGYPRGDVAAQIRVHRVHHADGRGVLRGARADDARRVRQRRKRAHSRRRARVRDRRPLCRQTRRARLRHHCLGARAADLLSRVRDDRLRPQLGLRGFVLNWDFGNGRNYPYFFLNWTSPAGVFGFGGGEYFMGTFWWILVLIALVFGIALAYAAILKRVRGGAADKTATET